MIKVPCLASRWADEWADEQDRWEVDCEIADQKLRNNPELVQYHAERMAEFDKIDTEDWDDADWDKYIDDHWDDLVTDCAENLND